MDLTFKNISLSHVIDIAITAGERILEIYNTDDFQIELKKDESPLTRADKASHQIIITSLQKAYPHIPVISEEGTHLSYSERRKWEYVWLVDPLDGTKEFINRNGEFSVNIGLVKNQKPILGVIYVPVIDTLYFAKQGLGSFKIEHCRDQSVICKTDDDWVEQALRIPLRHTYYATEDSAQTQFDPRTGSARSLKVVVSRSHFSVQTEQFLNTLKHDFDSIQLIKSGSSLKMCLFAEGIADIYPRLSQSMEWDTAAGEAIVENAGAFVRSTDGIDMKYNKQNLENPHHIVSRSVFYNDLRGGSK